MRIRISNLSVYLLVVLFGCFLVATLAITHWQVRDGRVEPQIDSAFNIKDPDDLIKLLDQEKRFAESEALKAELDGMKDRVTSAEERQPGTEGIERDHYASDEDCLKAEQTYSEIDFYISTAVPLENMHIRIANYLVRSVDKDQAPIAPDCTKIISLDFSHKAFEHLEGMQLRDELQITPEPQMERAIGVSKLGTHFGHVLYESLLKNKTSWVLHYSAASYWRSLGNASQAMECLRRALHFVPKQHDHVVQLAVSNILHRSKRSQDARVPGWLACQNENNPDTYVTFFNYANVLAVLKGYERAVHVYERVLELQKNFKEARQRLHALKCHFKLANKLEKQHDKLQKTLQGLQEYRDLQERYKDKIKEVDAFRANFADIAAREIKMRYFRERERQASAEGEQCEIQEQDGKQVLRCKWNKDREPMWANHKDKFHIQQAEEEDTEDTSSMTEKERIDRMFIPRRKAIYGKGYHAPKENSKAAYLQKDWPEECDQKITYTPISSIYLPADNKGFRLQPLVTDLLNLPADQEHPLPWYPPSCMTLYDLNDGEGRFDDLKGVSGRAHLSTRAAEDELKQHILSLVPRHDVMMEEVGQRLLSALRLAPAPSWLLYHLAGVYWRYLGNLPSAVECLRRAIHLSPKNMSDVPIHALSVTLYNNKALGGAKDDFTSDAVTLAKAALQINRHEPYSHLLLANLLAVQQEWSTARNSFREVLRRLNAYEPALAGLANVTCLKARESAAQVEQSEAVEQKSVQSCVTCSEISKEATSCEHEPQVIKLNTNGEEKKEEEARVEPMYQPDETETCTTDDCPGEPSSTAAAWLREDSDVPEHIQLPAIEDSRLPDTSRHLQLTIDTPEPPALVDCVQLYSGQLKLFTSTWVNIEETSSQSWTGKAFSLSKAVEKRQPTCTVNFDASATTLDNIPAVDERKSLDYEAEMGLKEIMQTYAGQNSIERFAALIAAALEENPSSHLFPLIASLYWRVQGDAPNAIDCLRLSLHRVDSDSINRVPALVAMANILQRTGRTNDAIVVMDQALHIDPKLVIGHFALGNIYADKEDLVNAKKAYLTTLQLQENFNPAHYRLMNILCAENYEKID